MKIAVSGFSGCGNTTASKLVARSLRLTRINYTLRNLAKDLKKPFEQVQEDAKETPEYDYAVDKKQIQFALKEQQCILASRLAIWANDARVLRKVKIAKTPEFDLKVWLDVPLAARAKRIAQREGTGLAETLAKTRKRDAENAKRYKALYGIDVAKLPKETLVVDAGKNNARQVAQIIITAAKCIKR